MRKVFVAIVSGAALAAAAGVAAGANSTTAQFNVSATVNKNCLVSGSDLNFGAYTPGAGDLNVNTSISVRCSKNTAYTVALDGGISGGTVAQRLLKNGTDALQYNLYTTAARNTIWGDGTSSTSTVGGTGAGVSVGSAQSLTIYGQLPDNSTNQDVNVPASGSFTDKITVTVSY